MYDRVWSHVMSGSYDKIDAKLYGCTGKKVANETYPALIPGTGKDFVVGNST